MESVLEQFEGKLWKKRMMAMKGEECGNIDGKVGKDDLREWCLFAIANYRYVPVRNIDDEKSSQFFGGRDGRD